MADVQQQENQQEAPVDNEREVAFYAAALDAFYTTSLEYDKGIFTLAAGGLGLLVTLLTTVGLTSRIELVAYLVGIVAFTVTLVLLLWIFRLNKSHIIAVVGGNDELSTRQLRIIETASMIVFGVGIICAAVVGVLAATDSYNTKVKAMTDNKKPSAPIVRNDSVQGIKNLRPDVLQKSFIDAGKLRPQASTGASAPATAKPAASTPQASGAAPTNPTSNPSGKGK
ncbi:hypothetical protein [Trinickia mobilis]|uniref:hypothetical protein n=1 Tax=Trinickia mobilis TaxID=2816356 RepID=UPI001A8C1FD7|nr:hypothetical protein [Trinickia mobilis]